MALYLEAMTAPGLDLVQYRRIYDISSRSPLRSAIPALIADPGAYTEPSRWPTTARELRKAESLFESD